MGSANSAAFLRRSARLCELLLCVSLFNNPVVQGDQWPGRPLDPYLAEEDRFGDFFQWYFPSGTVDEAGMKGVLDFERQAEGYPEVPVQYAFTLLSNFYVRYQTGLSVEDNFVEFYKARFHDRNNVYQRWRQCCIALLKPLPLPVSCNSAHHHVLRARLRKLRANVSLEVDAVASSWLEQLPLMCGTLEEMRPLPEELVRLSTVKQKKRVTQVVPPGGFARVAGAGAVAAGHAVFEKQAKGVCQTETILTCSLPAGPPPASVGGPPQGSSADKKELVAKYPAGRLAVLVVGLKDRFYPLSHFRHVVGPAARAGYEVDYHALLDWEQGRLVDLWAYATENAWPGKGDMPHLSIGTFNRAKTISEHGLANPAWGNVSKQEFLDYVARHARHYGASHVRVTLMQPAVQEDPLDPDSRRYFGYGSRLHRSFRRVRLRYKQIEMLWNSALNFQHQEGSGRDYSHVFLLRDDLHVAGDVFPRLFPDPMAIYSTSMGYPCEKPDPKLELKGSISDRFLVVGGKAAQTGFLRLHSLHREHPSLNSSSNNNDGDSDLDRVPHPEAFLFGAARVLGITWEVVRQDWLPGFVSNHYLVPNNNNDNNNNQDQQQVDGPKIAFCLRGLDRTLLQRPLGPCVHPGNVPFAGCDEVQASGADA